jgi:hypothetical protein
MIQTLDVACPVCDARPGWSCIGHAGKPRRPHRERVEAAEDADEAARQ